MYTGALHGMFFLVWKNRYKYMATQKGPMKQVPGAEKVLPLWLTMETNSKLQASGKAEPYLKCRLSSST